MTTTSGLTIVEPMAITDAMILATDVPEADYTAYSGGTTYALDAYTMVPATHKIYQSLQASNTGHDPATSPTWWIEVGYNNRWRLFDGKIGSATAQATSFYYRLAPGIAVTSIGFLNIVGAYTIRVRLIDATYGTVYDVITDVSAAPRSADWWEWAFGVWSAGQNKLVLLDLPAFPSAELRFDVTGGASLSVGAVVIGQGITFGESVQYGLRLALKDYSQKERDQWGNLDFGNGGSTDRNSFDLSLLNEDVDALYDYLKTILTTKCLFVVCDQFTSAILYGIYNTFEVVIAYPLTSDCTFDLESLT